MQYRLSLSDEDGNIVEQWAIAPAAQVQEYEGASGDLDLIFWSAPLEKLAPAVLASEISEAIERHEHLQKES